jgi:DNA-binding beta-propeller fold protein YncE
LPSGWPTLPKPASRSLNFESAPVHPVALSPNGQFLAVCNLPAGRLDLLDVGSGSPNISGPTNSIPVGVDPVSVRFRTATEVWVVNHISDSISVVDLSAGINRARVKATIDTLDTPSDVVFAGQPGRAFVSCARPNRIQVFEPSPANSSPIWSSRPNVPRRSP